MKQTWIAWHLNDGGVWLAAKLFNIWLSIMIIQRREEGILGMLHWSNALHALFHTKGTYNPLLVQSQVGIQAKRQQSQTGYSQLGWQWSLSSKFSSKRSLCLRNNLEKGLGDAFKY